ncbi:MAG: hydantoinase/oxoprolinase family protein [Bauldia sp.]
MAETGLRFAVDTGGTFTDLVVAELDGGLSLHKTATVPSDPVAGVINSLAAAAEASGEALADYLARGTLLVHGTTHAINAIVTGSTARTAFLTTQGHPDTLVWREGGRAEAFDFKTPYPEPYIPKALTFEIPGRIMVDGSVKTPLDEAATIVVLQRLAELKVQAVAVCLLWSIVNPEHEIVLGRLLEKHLPGVVYTLSHRVNPSIREYRRAMSTCIDASLKPAMNAYLGTLEERLRGAGFAGRVLIITSQGGVMDVASIAEAPVQLVNSGPSMGPVGAFAYSSSANTETLIVGDTGGTTFDVSLVRNGRIPRTRETWLGKPLVSHMTGMPSVDVRSIGAGGGSIAWVDRGGLLHVGPISAGAVPGPAAYRRGGTRPTVTDAALVLGFVDPDFFLGGLMSMDTMAAAEAVRRDIAEPLGKSVEEAAVAIIELATENMVQAIMDITVNQGVDPTETAFVAGGGAGGLNCVAIARRLGCRRVLVPEPGAALAAAGAHISDLTSRYHAMFHTNSDRFDRNAVNTVLARLEERCRTFASDSGAGTDFVVDWSTEARYPDQAWEIEVPLRASRFETAGDVAGLVADFHRTHQQVFAVSDPGSPIETVGWNAEVRCRIGTGAPGRVRSAGSSAKLPSRRVRFLAAKEAREVEVFRFEAIPTGATIVGPAIVESSFTSIVIDPGVVAARDKLGTLVIDV